MDLRDRQICLLDTDPPYFTRPIVQSDEHDALIQFGRVIRMNEYLSERMIDAGPRFEEGVQMYYRLLSHLQIPAWVFSPGGGRSYELIDVTTVIPISAALYASAVEVAFDLLEAPEVVMAQLQEVIDQLKAEKLA